MSDWETVGTIDDDGWETVGTVDAQKDEKKSLFQRSRDRLQLGVTDMYETLGVPVNGKMGPGSMGRYGDPTAPDNLNVAQRFVKAVGGDAIPAAGEVIFDAAIEGAKAVTPERVKIGDKEYKRDEVVPQAIGAVFDSAPAQYVSGKLDDWEEASPGTYATAGELANIALAGSPVKNFKALNNFKRAAADKASNFARKLKTERMTARLIPDDFTPLKADIGSYNVKPTGLKRKEFIAGPQLQREINTLVDVPEINPLNSYSENFNAATRAVDKLRKELDADLDKLPYRAKRGHVDDAINKTRQRIGDEVSLVGDQKVAADEVLTKLNKLLDSKTVGANTDRISVKDILDIRRELDEWAQRTAPNIFTSTTNARSAALTEIRSTLNNLAHELAPDANVANRLEKMHHLMNARTKFAPRSVSEGKTSFGRFIERIEAETGLLPPRTPASVRANMGPGEAAFVGATALGVKATDKLKGMPYRNYLSAQRIMADALRGSSAGAQRGALVGTFNDDDLRVPYRRK